MCNRASISHLTMSAAALTLVVGLLLYAEPAGAEACSVQLHPSSVVLRYGGSASANCTVSEGHLGIGWEASEGSVALVTGVQLITWRVENLTDWHIEPKCYENFMNGTEFEQCEEALQVTLYKTPDSVSISSVDHTGPMVEGRQYQLQCEVQNIAPVQNLTVKWYRGETEITEAEGNPTPKVTWYKDQSEVKSSTPLTRKDSGQYFLTARNSLGSSNCTLSLTVGYAPEFSCNYSYEVTEKQSYTLNCTAEGYPAPEVTWWKQGEKVELPAHLDRKHAGLYTLIANNTYGTANHTLVIKVLFPPAEIEQLEDREVDAGSSVQLRCSSWGNPQPNYSWQFQKAPNVEEVAIDGVSLLNISHASVKNQGVYNCSVQNRIGQISRSIRLTVREKDTSPHTPLTVGECPVQLHPSSVVVRYGDSASANCTVSKDHLGIGWEASEGSVDMMKDVQFVTWRVENLTDWHIEPKCYGNFMNGTEQCLEALQVTLYKTPDSVSISSVDHTGPMVEGRQYQLQCEVQNIAPVQNLTVKWYRGESLENETTFNSNTKTPMTVSSTLTITPSEADDGAQYSCVAELELGPEGPQPPPEVTSEPLKITVHYGPSIEIIPSPHPVIRGYSVELICNASGHPPPEVKWQRDGQAVRGNGGKLVISNAKEEHAGEYTCTARNSAGSDSVVVQVELKEDYLPIIAGLVALVVVVISIVFIFIYSIYYKNTKMGHYSLKSCKQSGQNGNVAQNGRDSSLPMKKLTQPNV
ncbi:hypothetical protein MATL_G00220130 [Megalops atlanticus]|uniref:Ig-like domain-containing protein n=1 Tax=Megalops atlanticus TaxID=7932 RepID=A0A9D3PHU5_MEGAT|nr:hypothetical protein MATL_G00220130 [Megalops atlanticus]